MCKSVCAKCNDFKKDPGARPGEGARWWAPSGQDFAYGTWPGLDWERDTGPSSSGPITPGGIIAVWCNVEWMAAQSLAVQS